ncbi:conserved hypothetical protein [Ricinus communis]|uniref:Uncharacterized protein n=1 Tax=Ricinus communis TaxID=3988 RepID=B9SQI4_RICCO|nr:conserved hypothetical protein [Ricinus communis]
MDKSSPFHSSNSYENNAEISNCERRFVIPKLMDFDLDDEEDSLKENGTRVMGGSKGTLYDIRGHQCSFRSLGH